MCTNGSTDILIVGTQMGSLYLYDLINQNTNPNASLMYNYEAVAEQEIAGFATLDGDKRQEALRKMMINYSITTVTYMSDGLFDYPHFSCIKKLVFISKSASGIS